jgi:hypothetical protein
MTKASFFGTDGIRGISNRGNITAEVALKLGVAAGTIFINGSHRHLVVIGKDTRLSGYLLEPALTVLPRGIDGINKTWMINSGYRLRGLTGGESPTSDHPKGRAFDIGIMPKTRDFQQYKKTYDIAVLLEKVLPYDQIILEYRYPNVCWIHVSYNTNSRKKQAFTMVNDSVYKGNVNGGFILLEDIPAPPKKS